MVVKSRLQWVGDALIAWMGETRNAYESLKRKSIGK
jgi:uncharacterized membrane protein YjdF